MNLERQIKQSLRKALDKAGSQVNLAELTGVKQPAINRLLNDRRPIGGMTINTLIKLFPEMNIAFFRDEQAENIKPLSPIIRKMIDLVSELDESAQLDLLTNIVRLIEQHKINRKK